MAERRERSAQEREAARRERERMRAARAQAGDEDEYDEDEDEYDEDEDEYDEDEDPEPGADEDQDAEPGADEDQDAEPAAEDQDAEPGADEDQDAEPRADEGEYEVPSGTRRVPRFEHLKESRRLGTRRRESEVPRELHRPSRAGHSWAGRALALVALIAGIALCWFLVELFQPLHGSGHGSVTVTIPARTSSSGIGRLLQRDGVIASGFLFTLRETLDGDRGKLLSGTYRLKLGMTYDAVLKILTTPPPAAKVTEVTIIPGEARSQIDAKLRAEGVAGSYLAATRHSPVLNPVAYRAPRDTPSLEGFLFPDTYQLREPISISALVTDQLQTFRRQFATVKLGYARSRHLAPYDVLIIASMVEAEARVARDQPLVASVIYNRLARDMPLQIDSTTRYLTGNYTAPLTNAQLSSPSPYNTRIHKGLPPTPIDSPSLASIQAAAHPARTNYLYYVVKVCGDGAQTFASSYQKFQADVAQYNEARAKRGGRSPEFC